MYDQEPDWDMYPVIEDRRVAAIAAIEDEEPDEDEDYDDEPNFYEDPDYFYAEQQAAYDDLWGPAADMPSYGF